MTAGDEESSVRAAVDGELQLHRPEVRASPERVLALLHPEFTEVGASGWRWDRTSITDCTAADPGTPESAITTSGMAGVLLAPGVVHLTYVSEYNGLRAHRSSLWRSTPYGWRLYFHQGTPAAPPGDCR